MVFDIDSTAVPWPGIVIVISAGSITCTVLLLVLCTRCFKTQVPQYRAKLTKNVVAKEDIRRYTPEKRKLGNRDNRMHSLIFDGAPIGSGRWDDLFVTGEETVPNEFKRDKPSAHANPPDVIMHPALLRVLNKESRNITQGEAIIVPTNLVTSPSRPPHPSSNLQELIQQAEDAEKGKFSNDVSPLGKFPLRREPSQEFNRDGSILYYKPRRDVTPKEHESKQNAESPAKISRDSSRSDDPITSRILETKHSRKPSRREPRRSPRLPRFNRTSGEWDNVPKPGWSVDTPPPIPSRNYSIAESDVATDCSETMPRPVIEHNSDRIPVEAERTKLNIIQESTRQSSGLSRVSSRSSGASSRNLPRSPDSGHLKLSNVKNPSPISDTVFIPNENPAYARGSATPPGHTPRKDHRRYAGDGRMLHKKDEYHLSVMSDGSFELVDEAKRTNHRNKRVDGIISDHNGKSPRRWKAGVYYRPKPYYQHLKIPEKRYSDASDYSDVMFERTNSFVRKTPSDDNPYFFRSRWSSAFETPAEVRRHADVVSNGAKSESRGKEIVPRILPVPSSSNESSPDRLLRNNQPQPSQRPSRSNRAARQDIPLPEAPFPYSSRVQRRDVSLSKRTHGSHASPSKWPHGLRDSRCEASPSKRSHEPRRPLPQPPLEDARVHPPSLEIVINQHKDDVLVSPGHQPNYPVDVAKIRRGLQQSSSEGKTKDYSLPSDRCDETTDRNSDFDHSAKSLNVPDNQKIRRASSEYGSLIDILYSYRQNVRQSRVKEKPMETRESRLKFEREKLKSKLREVLEPREMQSKNVEMVVETLLFLCETDSSRDNKKHSWQRDVHSDTNTRRPRSNSFEIVTPTDEKHEADFGVYDVGNWDDYARIRSHSDSRHSLVKNGENDQTGNVAQTNFPSASDDDRVAHATPAESTDKEFAFPTVEELDRILRQESTPPPVPLRRHHITQSSDVIPPPVAPRKPKTPRKALPPTPDENIPNGKIINLERHKQFPNGKNNEHNVSEQKIDSNEPDYAKIRKRVSRKRRKSLPSRHLTESEIRWLQNSGGNADKVLKDVEQFPHGNNKIVPPLVRARDRSGAILNRRDLPSPPEPPKEAPEATFSFDDIPVDETTDAEDIIKALERKMSQNQLILSHNNGDQSPMKNRNSPKLHSDSEIGTWSSVTSSEIPVPPPRARLQRYEGTSPKHENATSQSPVFLRKTYHTPPSSGGKRPRNPVAGALSPLRSVHNFQTPPVSPQANHSHPIANSKKFASATNVSVTPSSTPSPKIKGRGSRSSNISVTPPLTPSPKIKARDSYFLSPNRQQSVPYRPQPTPKKSPHHMGFIPNLARRTTRFTPNIPIMSKRLIQPTSQHDIVVPIESDRRRISRTGEIVYLPDDDDYAQPVDAVTMESSNRIQTSQYLNRGDMSPSSPLFNLERHSFYPIVEDEDYAVPVNQAPNTLLQQRIYAKSMENIMSEYESSV